jgi:ArsR family transcriptional regulator
MSNPEQILHLRLQAVVDPTRRKILRLLKEKKAPLARKEAGLSAAEVEERIQLSQPTISHHMSILTRSGLVEAQKIGHWRRYHRNEAVLRQFARNLRQSL